MKKKLLIFAFAVLSVLVASCQKEDVGKITPSDPVVEDETNVLTSFTTPAGPDADTKLQYGYVDNSSSWKVTKTWEPGKDTLIGFEIVANTDPVQYKYFTFACNESAEPGKVKWTRVSDNKYSDAGYPRNDTTATLYMAYAPGVKASGFKDDGEINFTKSLINQNDGKQMTVTCGTGTYDEDNSEVKVTFSNKMAMLAIVQPTLKGVTSAKTIYDVSLDNVYTAGTLKLVNNKLDFVKDENSTGLIYQKLASGLTTAENGLLNDTIYVPIIPGTNLNQLKVRISTTDEDYEYSVSKSADIDTVLYRIANKEFTAKKVAKYSTDGGSSWTECSTIMEAMNAVSQSETAATVQILEDCTIKSAMDSITNTKGVTLDLNGYTLRSTAANINYKEEGKTDKIDDRRVYVAGGNLTIKDSGTTGKLTDNLSNTHLIIVTGGTLNVESGTLESTASAAVYVPENSASSESPITIKLVGGTLIGESETTGAVGIKDNSYVNLTVSGSTIKSTTSRGIYTGSKTIVSMTNGVIDTKSVCFNHNGTIDPEGENTYGLHITGGDLIAATSYPVYLYKSTSKCCIESNAYLSAVDNYTIYCNKLSTSAVTIKITGENVPYFHRANEGKIIAKANDSGASFSVSGGYFSTNDGLPGKIAEGYDIITLDTPVTHPTHTDKSFSYQVAVPTAYIFEITDGTTTKKYSTPGAAMDALFGDTPESAFTGGQITVKLLDNYSLSEMMTFAAAENSGKTYTFDLNEKTLTTGSSYAYLKAEKYTDLTIKNGTITGNDYYCFYPTNSTTVTINSDVTIENSGTTRGAIYLVGYSNLTLNGCTVIVSNTNSTQSAIYVNNSNAKLTVKTDTRLINDGKGRTLNATVGTISIEDGVKSRPYIPSINLSSTQYQDKFATGDDFATVQSGPYSGDADAFFECIPMSLNDAVTKANSVSAPSTIKLLKDVTLTAMVDFSTADNNYNLNLNNRTITETANYYIKISAENTVNISGDGNISQSNNQYAIEATAAKKANPSTVTITNVTVTSTSDSKSAIRVEYSTVTLDGNTDVSGNYRTIYTASGASTVNIGGSASVTGTGAVALYVSYGKANISSGSLTSTTTNVIYATSNADKITISGGKIKTGGDVAIIYKAEAVKYGDKYSLTGGLYSKAPASGAIASGYEIADNDDATTKDEYTKKVQQKSN